MDVLVYCPFIGCRLRPKVLVDCHLIRDMLCRFWSMRRSGYDIELGRILRRIRLEFNLFGSHWKIESIEMGHAVLYAIGINPSWTTYVYRSKFTPFKQVRNAKVLPRIDVLLNANALVQRHDTHSHDPVHVGIDCTYIIWLEYTGYKELVPKLLSVHSFERLLACRIPYVHNYDPPRFERSVVLPGSACGTCGTPLRWWENLPIVAYFYLGGRCSVCGSSYSWRYAAIEAFTACMSVFLYYFYNGVNAEFVYAFIFLCLLIVVFFTDFDHWIILDSISYGGMIVGLVGAFFIPMRADFTFFDFSLLPDCLKSYEAAGNSWLNGLSSLYGIVLGASFYWAIQSIGKLVSRQNCY